MPRRVVGALLALFSCALCGCGGDSVVVPLDLSEDEVADPAWSPDGSRIAFSTGAGLFVLDLRRHVVRRLGNGYEPAWARDGKRLAWAWNAAIYVGDASGKRRKRIATPAVDVQSAASPDWSPHGSRIAYSVSGSLEPDLVLVVDADGGAPRILAKQATARMPAWSPSGRELVFGDLGSLVVMRADGTNKHHLRPLVHALQPAWSPDGRLIAFERIGAGISVMNATGGGLRRLTRNSFDSSPTWSPDGGRIAFARARSACGIYVIAVRGGKAKKLTGRCD